MAVRAFSRQLLTVEFARRGLLAFLTGFNCAAGRGKRQGMRVFNMTSPMARRPAQLPLARVLALSKTRATGAVYFVLDFLGLVSSRGARNINLTWAFSLHARRTGRPSRTYNHGSY